MTDVTELRRLIDLNPWATLVSAADDGLVASHYAVLLDDRDDLTIVGHVGRPDDLIHGLGSRELMVVIQGPHGYVSPGWYGDVAAVPTWNFVSAHLAGVPELLGPEENLRILDRLVARFESGRPQPRTLWEAPNDPAFVERLERGTVGFRLTPTKVVAKRKLSQNKPDDVVETIIAELGAGAGAYADPRLAGEMRRDLDTRRAAR
ncbi:transcriptional regulator [Microbacterium thalassium]|uniref:Transcriptional regulator n=2 Tax=Microbacterium thalassium TaxID=362649 RepID=A0A7X0FR96_9MICO|nr:transcriptional regulator [Microbacterium thalassium]